MHKIQYPINISKLKDFKKEFENAIISSKRIDINKIQQFLGTVGITEPFVDIILMPLEKLITLNPLSNTSIFTGLSKLKKKNKKDKIKSLFKYAQFQQSELSNFFMKYDDILKIYGCCYCGIDFINSYIPFNNDYRDFEHFMNECTEEDLMKIYGFGKDSADIIISDYKGKITNYGDISDGLNNRINNILKKLTDSSGQLKYDNLRIDKNNSFTLDHLLPQSEYPYLSLSLFNLVPSCYSCNSKLKGKKNIYLSLEELNYTSPSGSKRLTDLIFKIYFKTGFDNKNLPRELNEYSVKIESKFPEYFKIFNLQGRYNFHKNISQELISKRRIYSDSKIKEISNFFKGDGVTISENEIKNQIFGSDVFAEDSNKPFQKYKKDIAKQLKLI